MRKPEEIEKQITLLEEELERSKKHYEYNILWSGLHSIKNDMIGFFNLGKARTILNSLYDGKQLQFRHEAIGTFNVHMNSQKNRILVSGDNEEISEKNIMNFIVWNAGDWYEKVI